MAKTIAAEIEKASRWQQELDKLQDKMTVLEIEVKHRAEGCDVLKAQLQTTEAENSSGRRRSP